MSQPQQRKRQKKAGPAPGVRKDFNRIEAAGSPWWAEGPSVIGKCVSLVFAPFRVAAAVLNAAVAACFLALVVVGWMWWTGRIPDAVVSGVIAELGDRILSIVKNSGII